MIAIDLIIFIELIVAAATDAAIHRKMFGSGNTTIISNEEMNDIIKIIKSLEESDLLIKSVSETSKENFWIRYDNINKFS